MARPLAFNCRHVKCLLASHRSYHSKRRRQARTVPPMRFRPITAWRGCRPPALRVLRSLGPPDSPTKSMKIFAHRSR
eukprot:1169724-Prymnesium_polylepis.4